MTDTTEVAFEFPENWLPQINRSVKRWVLREVEWRIELAHSKGGSPIETAMEVAFEIVGMMRPDMGQVGIVDYYRGRTFLEAMKMACHSTDQGGNGVHVEREVIVGDYRVDFMVIASLDVGQRFMAIAVECDGHNFHYGDKKQISRDRERDRVIQQSGIQIFRFTGSDIWKDCMKCVQDVFDAIENARDAVERGSGVTAVFEHQRVPY